MKKNLIWAILFSFGLGVAVQAESISSISYNPSRLGLYQQLRVTDTLRSVGNIKVSDKAFIKGDTALLSKDNAFEIEYTNASSGTVYMPNTDLNAKTLNINGGKAIFLKGSLPNLLRDTRIMAKSLNMGSVKINHDRPEGSVKGYDVDIRGLKLGGNDIPLPPKDCTGNLVWAKQKIGDKIQEVLAVTGCAEQSGSSGACTLTPEICMEQNGYGGFTVDTNTCTCKCPSNKSGQSCQVLRTSASLNGVIESTKMSSGCYKNYCKIWDWTELGTCTIGTTSYGNPCGEGVSYVGTYLPSCSSDRMVVVGKGSSSQCTNCKKWECHNRTLISPSADGMYRRY